MKLILKKSVRWSSSKYLLVQTVTVEVEDEMKEKLRHWLNTTKQLQPGLLDFISQEYQMVFQIASFHF